MFNINDIRFIKTDEDRNRSTYSFVGIKKNKEEDQLEFWMPLGFGDFDESFESTKDFFFKMYKTFKIYLKKKQDSLEEDAFTRDRDGIGEIEGGFDFTNEREENSVFYGKLNAIDKIIEGYDELKIAAIENRKKNSPDIDFSKIYQHLHQAVYLENHVIYIDEMNTPKKVLLKTEHSILQLFCYIYFEIKKELAELENLDLRVVELAENFKEDLLNPNDNLFSEDTFEDTLNVLKKTLEDIDLYTTYKDEDYWHFYEAVESFLYGERDESEEGIHWGMSSFYDVWEDMCQTYVLNHEDYQGKVLYADVNGRLEQFTRRNPNPFEVKLNGCRSRYLRPDLVYVDKIEMPKYSIQEISKWTKQGRRGLNNAVRIFFDNDQIYQNYRRNFPKSEQLRNDYSVTEKNYFDPNKQFVYLYKDDYRKWKHCLHTEHHRKNSSLPIFIIDYKYMRTEDYERYSPNLSDAKGKNKVKEDIHKQLVYEWSVQQNWKKDTQSEFWIPFFSEEANKFSEQANIENVIFNESQIIVRKINFKTIQEYYLETETL